ncbi:hypothetical protein CN645_11810 [Burkholderia sp. IDO3]|nr:hypothetical protein DCN14_23985 [Burkholderia sp. IDO3]PCD61669.1 hypothetical protein CN645_11810 [Burkholderia sp. IDO3]
MSGRPAQSCALAPISSIRHCRRAGRCASDDCPVPAAGLPASGDKKGQPGLPFRAVPVHCNHRIGARLTLQQPCRWRVRRTCS